MLIGKKNKEKNGDIVKQEKLMPDWLSDTKKWSEWTS